MEVALGESVNANSKIEKKPNRSITQTKHPLLT